MQWNVFYYNINRKKIETYNIFEHGCFRKYVIEALENHHEKNSFAEKLKSELTYYFWSKSEWEIIITPWLCGTTDKMKVDVFDQVMLNFDILVDYVWSNREEWLKERAHYA